MAAAMVAAAACTAPPDDVGQSLLRTDAAITAQVQSSYFADPVVKGMAIDVDTADGVVTLTGTVSSDLEKNRALQAAESVEGVDHVVDQLKVSALPEVSATAPAVGELNRTADAGQAPGWITTKIEAQYFLDPGVKGRNIEVITATDGTVTLTGEVDSPAARMQALAIARATDGVTRVIDAMTSAADSMPEPTEGDEGDRLAEATQAVGDAWTTTRVQARYFVDPDIKGRDIDVTTVDGIVTLTGIVESAAERREAVALALEADDVLRVEDELQVVPPSSDGMGEMAETVTDAWVTTKIQAQYFVDPEVSSLAINVTTEDRVVTLEGEVETMAEKSLAESIARETRGVADVVSRLTVNQ
jgi:osmotically-inducible protein OsmY